LFAEEVVADLVFGVVDTTVHPVVADVGTPWLKLEGRIEVAKILGA
jgi:hypothetical protein